jgi:hypothetical protein
VLSVDIAEGGVRRSRLLAEDSWLISNDVGNVTLTALGLKEAEMRLIGYDFHASQQSIAMLDRDTGCGRREDVEARRRGRPRVLCLDSAAGRGRSRHPRHPTGQSGH